MYIFVAVSLRLMGKRQIGDMQPSDLVITLLISDIATIPLQDPSQPIINSIASLLLLVAIEILVSAVAMKSASVGDLLSGKAIIIMHDGKIDIKAMKSVRMTVIDLIEQLRKQGIFDIGQVDSAILEVGGDLSVKLKDKFEPLSPKTLADFNKDKLKNERLCLPVVCDGTRISCFISALGINDKQIEDEAASRGAKVKDVFLMTSDGDKFNTVIIKDDKK